MLPFVLVPCQIAGHKILARKDLLGTLTQPADTEHQLAWLAPVKMQEIGRRNVVVYQGKIGSISDVIQTEAEGPLIAPQGHLSFKMQVEAEKARKFPVVDLADLPSFIVVDSEQETIPPLQEIDDRVILGYRKETPA